MTKRYTRKLQQETRRDQTLDEEITTEDLFCLYFRHQPISWWQGPYKVLKKMGGVNYHINEHDHRKYKSVPCEPLLNRWTSECLWEDGILDWKISQEDKQPQLGKQLSEQEKKEILMVIIDFMDVLQSIPTQIELIEHTIDTGSARPVRLPPYRTLKHIFLGVI